MGVKRVYQSCGNQIWENGCLIQESNFYLDNKMKTQLNRFLDISDWGKKIWKSHRTKSGSSKLLNHWTELSTRRKRKILQLG